MDENSVKVLAVVNGFGLGNATRCEPVLSALAARNASIDVASSGNGLAFFRARPYPKRIFTLRSFDYGRPSREGLSTFSLLGSLPLSLWKVFTNAVSLVSVLKRERYDLIVVDSDYSAFFFKWFARAPIVALNNSRSVLRECLRTTPPVGLWPQFVIEIFDSIFHHLIPDLTLAPTLEPRPRRSGTVVDIPLVSRLSRSRNATSSKPHVVFVFSASNLGHDAEEFAKLCPSEVTYELITKENRRNADGSMRDISKELERADVIVSNAGLGTISDAVALGTPIVVVPIEGHCEQWVNGRIVERLRIGEVADAGTFTSKLSRVLAGLDRYRDSLNRIAGENEDAVDRALEEIDDLLSGAPSGDERAEAHAHVTMDLGT